MQPFPESLKSWRKAKRFSQLQLAVEADVSSRHISFLETGRARPSRDMIGRLARAMHLPLHAHNQLLTHAGYAARYSGRRWDGEAMAPIRAAVSHMLQAHAPYPGLAIDRLWTVVQMNRPAQMMFGTLGVREGDSLLDLLTSGRLPEHVENWPEVAHHAAQRLRTESAAQGGVARLDAVADQLAGVGSAGKPVDGPVMPTIFRMGETRLSLFTTLAQFGTPEDLALEDLKIELYFPADDTSATLLKAMAGSARDEDQTEQT